MSEGTHGFLLVTIWVNECSEWRKEGRKEGWMEGWMIEGIDEQLNNTLFPKTNQMQP